jgi:hypothetical protein
MDTNQNVSSPETQHKYASTLANQVSTTISTIVVQGGPLQLVIALLKVSLIHFKSFYFSKTSIKVTNVLS